MTQERSGPARETNHVTEQTEQTGPLNHVISVWPPGSRGGWRLSPNTNQSCLWNTTRIKTLDRNLNSNSLLANILLGTVIPRYWEGIASWRTTDGSAALVTLLALKPPHCPPSLFYFLYYAQRIELSSTTYFLHSDVNSTRARIFVCFLHCWTPRAWNSALHTAAMYQTFLECMDGWTIEWLLGSWVNMSRAQMRPKMETCLCVTCI